jgi:pseudaminic acid synthase
MKIKINKKITFDTNKRPLIVAEISGNHNGKKKKFLEHIKSAAKNGADMIKIQTYEPSDITQNSKKKQFLVKDGIWKNKNLFELYKKTYTPFKWHKDAFELCKKLKIPIFSSPFSSRGVKLLEKLNTPIYKLASLEITDFNLINEIAKTRKPIIISTGCATIPEIKKCLKIVYKYHKKIIILHSVTKYPTEDNEANIPRINQLKKIFKNIMIGLSDHTKGIHSSLAATSLGIVLIEKHFIINKQMMSEDKKFSIDEKDLKNLKISSEKIFNMLNAKIQNYVPNKKHRRSIFAKKYLPKGIIIKKNDIVSLRPKIGICSSNFFKIIGKKTKKNIKKGQPIYKNNI